MGMAEKVKILLMKSNMTQTEVARLLGTTQSNLAGKLQRDNLCERDLQAIAKICGVRFEGSFIFEDGKVL